MKFQEPYRILKESEFSSAQFLLDPLGARMHEAIQAQNNATKPPTLALGTDLLCFLEANRSNRQPFCIPLETMPKIKCPLKIPSPD
jgi:hypothetical protein